MKIRASILLCLTLFLTACGSQPTVITKPEIVTITRTERVPIPEPLTDPILPTVIPDALTYGEAIEQWSRDRAIILSLNARLKAVRDLGRENGEQE